MSGAPTFAHVAREIGLDSLLLGYREATLFVPLAGHLPPMELSLDAPFWSLHLELYGSLLVLCLVSLRAHSIRAHRIAVAAAALSFGTHPMFLFVLGHLASLLPHNGRGPGKGFLGLLLLPVDFPYWAFATLIALNGIGSGLFSAPNTSAVMSSVPAGQRGVASGMRATAMNAGTVLSIGVFFSLLIAGLARSLPGALGSGLAAAGVPADAVARATALPPVGSVFAAFLGVNPVQQLLGPDVIGTLPADKAAELTGRSFFPGLISGPFHSGLIVVFTAAAVMSVVAAVVSLARGNRYVHTDQLPESPAPEVAAATAR